MVHAIHLGVFLALSSEHFSQVVEVCWLCLFAFLDKSDPRADGSIEYKCQLCGYGWFHIPGAPWPTVNVRPELIREGAEKLRQEEEERQRRRRMND